MWVERLTLCSLARSCDCIQMITPTRRAGSRFNMVQRRLRSDSRVELLLLLTRERLLGVILVRGEGMGPGFSGSLTSQQLPVP